MRNTLYLLVSVAIPLCVGWIGSLFTTPAIPGWYAGLEKPFFSPPNWVFGPVWTLLYVLMGFAWFLVWKNPDFRKKRNAGILFFGHLALNFAWSAIFFGMRNPFLAFLEILALLISIAALIFVFWKVRKVAAILLVPYFLWVSFAAILNFEIWRMNAGGEVARSPHFCESDTGMSIGEKISFEGNVFFNAADGSWYVIERIPEDERRPYAYLHRKEGAGALLEGKAFGEGILTGFDPESRRVFFNDYPCLPDVEIGTISYE